MVLKRSVYVRNVINFSPSFISQKTQLNFNIWNIFSEIFTFGDFGLYALNHVYWKLAIWGSALLYDVIVTSYVGCLYLFWYV